MKNHHTIPLYKIMKVEKPNFVEGQAEIKIQKICNGPKGPFGLDVMGHFQRKWALS